MKRGLPGVHLIVWGLLSLWLFFGGLELAEDVHLVSETTEEAQNERDLDQEALSQLASGLKSEVSGLGIPWFNVLSAATPESPCLLVSNPGRWIPQLHVHSPPSLRLHQQYSVYRI